MTDTKSILLPGEGNLAARDYAREREYRGVRLAARAWLFFLWFTGGGDRTLVDLSDRVQDAWSGPVMRDARKALFSLDDRPARPWAAGGVANDPWASGRHEGERAWAFAQAWATKATDGGSA